VLSIKLIEGHLAKSVFTSKLRVTRGKLMNKLLTRAMLVFLLQSGFAITQRNNSQQLPADNSKINQRDGSQDEPTAEQQNKSSSDRAHTPNSARKRLVN
jgi:hypothetical protein